MANGSYKQASQAINDLLSYVDTFAEVREIRGGFTNRTLTADEIGRFIELDERLYVALGRVELLNQLPSHDVLSSSLDVEDGMKKVEFKGKSRLPGDWDDGLFMLVECDWRREMEELQALLSDRAKETPEYSKARSPSEWCKIYERGGVPISLSTFQRMQKGDPPKIRTSPDGTTRQVRIDKRDLPPGFNDDAS
jgi:hypothetical protein